jgi:hypothetical protein
MIFMKKTFYFLAYLGLFLVGFTLLKYANVLDMNNTSRSEMISKFFVMIIVLIAVTRWGINLYTRLTGYKHNEL